MPVSQVPKKTPFETVYEACEVSSKVELLLASNQVSVPQVEQLIEGITVTTD